MPVTINGNGSITGLSVGGLGSGVVNDTTLASNAVTTAKIASGAITRSTLPSVLFFNLYLVRKQMFKIQVQLHS